MFNWRTNTALASSRSRIAKMVLAAAILSVLIVFTQVRASYAGQLTIHVQNSRGFSVAGATINYGPDWVDPDPGNTATSGATDANGNWTGDPGSTFSVTRGSQWPEGTAGVAGSATGGNVTVSLSSLSDAFPSYVALAPALSASERWVVGRINQERALVGADPLQISVALTLASDMYANHLANNEIVPSIGDGHNQVLGPPQRAVDAGWNDFNIGENIVANGVSAEDNFNWWWNSPGHRSNMLDPAYKSIGVAFATGSLRTQWVTDFATNICALPQCGMTGDYGDPTLDPGDGSGNGPGGGELLKPSLKVKRAKRVVKRGRKVKTSVTVRKGDGMVRASLRSGKTKAKIKTAVKISADGTKSYAFSATPKKTGRWTLTIRFSGRGDWDDKVITQRIRVKK